VYNSKQCTEPVGTIVENVLFGTWTQDETDLLNVGKAQELALRAKLP
jgi:UDP-N-acetylglucosamine kinase